MEKKYTSKIAIEMMERYDLMERILREFRVLDRNRDGVFPVPLEVSVKRNRLLVDLNDPLEDKDIVIRKGRATGTTTWLAALTIAFMATEKYDTERSKEYIVVTNNGRAAEEFRSKVSNFARQIDKETWEKLDTTHLAGVGKDSSAYIIRDNRDEVVFINQSRVRFVYSKGSLERCLCKGFGDVKLIICDEFEHIAWEEKMRLYYELKVLCGGTGRLVIAGTPRPSMNVSAMQTIEQGWRPVRHGWWSRLKAWLGLEYLPEKLSTAKTYTFTWMDFPWIWRDCKSGDMTFVRDDITLSVTEGKPDEYFMDDMIRRGYTPHLKKIDDFIKSVGEGRPE